MFGKDVAKHRCTITIDKLKMLTERKPVVITIEGARRILEITLEVEP